MSVYLIDAAEAIYEGLHGISDAVIIETDNEKEVREIGHNMSIELMERYGDIGETLLEDARTEAELRGIYDEDEPEFEEILNEQYEANVTYDYWKLKEGLTLEEYKDKLREIGAEELGHLYGC